MNGGDVNSASNLHGDAVSAASYPSQALHDPLPSCDAFEEWPDELLLLGSDFEMSTIEATTSTNSSTTSATEEDDTDDTPRGEYRDDDHLTWPLELMSG
jgi:hypothetical protein